ncbi:MAG: dihydroorotate dehydrogenase electron transfer subunit [Marinilabiliales bacterium]|nr:MAG: dihydroorotate dehydrogenase electron transfer subunit [Marinilabiliales bacterium]
MKRIQDFKFKEYKWLNYQNYILTLKTTDTIAEIKPGNFAELKIPNAPDVFLRRPLSVLDVDHDENTISFYVKIIGKGTEKLGKLRGGDKVNVIYPLGNSFSINGTNKALLVGGGSGIAPFILLGRELKQKGVEITFLIGARTKEDVLLTNEFKKLGDVLVTTEDGTMGQTGLVTHHSVFSEEFQFDKIYTCGPDPMMKAIAEIAVEKGVDCEASLENMMACGFGACLCCVVETHGGNKCVCTEGPVFNTKDLAW